MLNLKRTIDKALYASIDFRNATITLKDGAAATLEIKSGEGNFTFSEKIDYQYTLNRGKLDDVRLGDEKPVEVSFDCLWETIYTNGTDVEVGEFLRGEGNLTSTDSDACRPYACDIEVKYVNAVCTNGSGTFLLQDFRVESVDYDMSAGTISVSGKCNTTTVSKSENAA